MTNTVQREADQRSGVVAGLGAYILWGAFPVYFKLIDAVAPTEVLMHRIIWSVPVGAAILSLRGQWGELFESLRRPQVMPWLTLSSLIISANWFVYVWAIINDRIFETSLGYYINPLVYVLAGVVFFGERLRRAQLAALALATIGVLFLAIQGGTIPWVSFSLALLFTAYGVIRKRVAIGAMPGLFAETTLLFPLAFAALLWLMLGQQATFPAPDTATNVLLLLAGPFTVIPLLFFSVAARRLSLTTVGFMQFLAPTLQFLTGLYYGELLTTAHLFCFGFIWLAVALFSYDAVLAGRRQNRALQNA